MASDSLKLMYKTRIAKESSVQTRRMSRGLERKKNREDEINKRRPGLQEAHVADVSLSPVFEFHDLPEENDISEKGKKRDGKNIHQRAATRLERLQQWREEKKRQNERDKKGQGKPLFKVSPLRHKGEAQLYKKTETVETKPVGKKSQNVPVKQIVESKVVETRVASKEVQKPKDINSAPIKPSALKAGKANIEAQLATSKQTGKAELNVRSTTRQTRGTDAASTNRVTRGATKAEDVPPSRTTRSAMNSKNSSVRTTRGAVATEAASKATLPKSAATQQKKGTVTDLSKKLTAASKAKANLDKPKEFLRAKPRSANILTAKTAEPDFQVPESTTSCPKHSTPAAKKSLRLNEDDPTAASLQSVEKSGNSHDSHGLKKFLTEAPRRSLRFFPVDDVDESDQEEGSAEVVDRENNHDNGNEYEERQHKTSNETENLVKIFATPNSVNHVEGLIEKSSRSGKSRSVRKSQKVKDGAEANILLQTPEYLNVPKETERPSMSKKRKSTRAKNTVVENVIDILTPNTILAEEKIEIPATVINSAKKETTKSLIIVSTLSTPNDTNLASIISAGTSASTKTRSVKRGRRVTDSITVNLLTSPDKTNLGLSGKASIESKTRSSKKTRDVRNSIDLNFNGIQDECLEDETGHEGSMSVKTRSTRRGKSLGGNLTVHMSTTPDYKSLTEETTEKTSSSVKLQHTARGRKQLNTGLEVNCVAQEMSDAPNVVVKDSEGISMMELSDKENTMSALSNIVGAQQEDRSMPGINTSGLDLDLSNPVSGQHKDVSKKKRHSRRLVFSSNDEVIPDQDSNYHTPEHQRRSLVDTSSFFVGLDTSYNSEESKSYETQLPFANVRSSLSVSRPATSLRKRRSARCAARVSFTEPEQTLDTEVEPFKYRKTPATQRQRNLKGQSFSEESPRSTFVSVSDEGTSYTAGENLDEQKPSVTPVHHQHHALPRRSLTSRRSARRSEMIDISDEGTSVPAEDGQTSVYHVGRPVDSEASMRALQELSVKKVVGETSFIEVPLDESINNGAGPYTPSSFRPMPPTLADTPLHVAKDQDSCESPMEQSTHSFTPRTFSDLSEVSSSPANCFTQLKTLEDDQLTGTTTPPKLTRARGKSIGVLSAFKTPGQPASARQTRSQRKRRKTEHSTPSKSADEMIEILKKSPMIELSRRRSRLISFPAPAETHSSTSSPHLNHSDASTSGTESLELSGATVLSQTTAEQSQLPQGNDATINGVGYFRRLLLLETTRLNQLCHQWNEISLGTPEMGEEAQGQIRSVVGKAQLLMEQRFKQFSGLVDNCEYGLGEKETTLTDLQGFWDMIYFQVKDVDQLFTQLSELQQENWVLKTEASSKRLLKQKKVIKIANPKVKSNFTAFRMEMIKRKAQAAAKSAAPSSSGEEETKTFDANFFKVQSPVRSPARETTKELNLHASKTTQEVNKLGAKTDLLSTPDSKNLPEPEPTKSTPDSKNLPEPEPTKSTPDSKNLPEPEPTKNTPDSENLPELEPTKSTSDSKNLPELEPTKNTPDSKNLPEPEPTKSTSAAPDVFGDKENSAEQTPIKFLPAKRLNYLPAIPSPLLNDITGVILKK